MRLQVNLITPTSRKACGASAVRNTSSSILFGQIDKLVHKWTQLIILSIVTLLLFYISSDLEIIQVDWNISNSCKIH